MKWEGRKFRIIWSSKATGTEETVWIGKSLTEAHKAAHKMIGETVFWEGEPIDKITSAYVADKNGNPL